VTALLVCHTCEAGHLSSSVGCSWGGRKKNRSRSWPRSARI
jgi:hypothetical protein